MKLVVRGFFVLFFIVLAGALLTVAIAGSTKGSKAININANWSRSDAQKEFYQYEFPTMYNAVVKDLDTLYAKVGTATGDSLYKPVLKASRVWIDTVKTAALYIPGRIAVDTNDIAQHTITGILEVDTMAVNTTFLGNVGVDDSITIAGTSPVIGISYHTITYDPPSILAGAIFDSTFYFEGVNTSGVVAANPPYAFESDLEYAVYPVADDSVRIQLHNDAGAPVDGASGVWRLMRVDF